MDHHNIDQIPKNSIWNLRNIKRRHESGNFNTRVSQALSVAMMVSSKEFCVIIIYIIGFYIKEFNHDNVSKGAICCA